MVRGVSRRLHSRPSEVSMGGYGSSRWGMTLTRMTTAGLLRLDVCALARAGGLVPGKSATVTWDGAASITTEVPFDAPDVVTLAYSVRTSTESRVSINEQIPVLTTPCTFGGTRVWFACPGCGTRRAVLYALGGLFRCRTCHHIAHASTRTNPASGDVHHTLDASPPPSDGA